MLHRSRLPLLTWFWAAYLVATDDGINGLSLGRKLAIPSHKTAWSVLDRLRQAMSVLDLPPLSGVVEANETAVGGYCLSPCRSTSLHVAVE